MFLDNRKQSYINIALVITLNIILLDIWCYKCHLLLKWKNFQKNTWQKIQSIVETHVCNYVIIGNSCGAFPCKLTRWYPIFVDLNNIIPRNAKFSTELSTWPVLAIHTRARERARLISRTTQTYHDLWDWHWVKNRIV